MKAPGQADRLLEPSSRIWGGMEYLITGGAGFIGSHLAERVSGLGHRVTILDDLSTGDAANVAHLQEAGAVELVVGSVRDAELVDQLVAASDAVVHLAATVGVELIMRDPLGALRNNIDGTEVVLGACSSHRRRVVVASTSEVYGKNTKKPLGEFDDRIMGPLTRSRWAYATSKAVDEIIAYELWRRDGTPITVVRFFNCSGPRQTGAYGMVIPRFVRQAVSGEDLTVYGDGGQTRCFCHVADTVDAVVRLLDSDAAVGDVFNVGSASEISISDLAKRVIDLCDSPSGIRYLEYDEVYGEGFEDMLRRIPDITRIRGLVGWEPRRSLDDIVVDVRDHEIAQRGAARGAES
jgi:UDP-glucose 4-epimerase